jgi:hypothetical protein
VFLLLPFCQKIEFNGFHKVLSWETPFFNRAALKLQKSKKSGITATVFRFTDDTKQPE